METKTVGAGRWWVLSWAIVALWACQNPGGGGIEEEEDPNVEQGRPCSSFFDCDAGQRCGDDGFCVTPVCIDEDGDGYGENCPAGDDCDDENSRRNAGEVDLCDGQDEDCDFLIDEGNVCTPCEDECVVGVRECFSDTAWRECRTQNGCAIWQPLSFCEEGCLDGRCVEQCDDFDGDGFGRNCPAGEDCDDRNPFVFPGNPERCDGYDNDCNGVVDDGGICDMPCEDPCGPLGERRCESDRNFSVCTTDVRGCPVWGPAINCSGDTVCSDGFCADVVECIDTDGDGYGPGCAQGNDCDNNDPSMRPGAPESCDGRDNDCNGRVDDGPPGCGDTQCASNPHNTPATARALAAGATGNGYTCTGQPGFWDLGVLPAGIEISAVVQRPDGTLPISMELLGPGLNVEKSVVGSGGAFKAVIASAGQRYLRVQAGTVASYVVGWQRSDVDCALVDAFEPNNSPFTSSPSLFPGQIIAGGICNGDLDFYSMPSLLPGQVLTVEMANDATGRLLLDVWYDGSPITVDQARPDSAVHTHTRLTQPGQYVVGVRGLDPSVTGNYVLSASISSISCPGDNQEPDDTILTATPLGNAASISGTICPGDLDFIDLGVLATNDNVDLSIEFNAGAANLDAFLMRESTDGLLQVALTDSAPERLPTRIPRGGRYYVLIMGRNVRDSTSYTFRR